MLNEEEMDLQYAIALSLGQPIPIKGTVQKIIVISDDEDREVKKLKTNTYKLRYECISKNNSIIFM